MKSLVIASVLLLSVQSFAGALRIPDGRGETTDYGITAAALDHNGVVTFEARRSSDVKQFSVSKSVLSTTGMEAGALIELVMNKDVYANVFCEVPEFSRKKSNPSFSCESLTVHARPK